MAYLSMLARKRAGVPLTPQERVKADAEQARVDALANNRQVRADRKRSELDRMQAIVEGQPCPPNGLNGGPLLRWESEHEHLFTPLQGEELGPVDLIGDNLERLLADIAKGESSLDDSPLSEPLPIPTSEEKILTPEQGEELAEMIRQQQVELAQGQDSFEQTIEQLPPEWGADSEEDSWDSWENWN